MEQHPPLFARPLAHATTYAALATLAFSHALCRTASFPLFFFPRRLPIFYMRALLSWLSAGA